MLIRTLIATALALIAFSAQADTFTPSHYCSKPYKPYKFTSESEVQRFKNEVEFYERCINQFVEDQQDAARRHREAAQRAIEEWNSFVRYELR